MKKYFSIYLIMAVAVILGLQSCNKDEDTTTTTAYEVYSFSSTMVSDFSLKANTKIMSNLDSVKFTIDQDRGLIYNADSLPRGTRINALLVEMTCASSVASKEFVIKNGDVLKDTVITYNASQNDSIDFTGDVTLRITSGDGNYVRNYKVKVNVHKLDVDTIVWNQSRRRDLPNVSSNLKASKTVKQNNEFLCLVNDNSNYVLSSSDDPLAGTWSKTMLALPFTPQVASFNATTDALYMLDTNGQLFKSTDLGASWTDCGVAWLSIVGGYDNKLLGIMSDGNGGYVHVEFNENQTCTTGNVDENFPLQGMSPLVMANNEWTSSQQAMIVGGVLANGNLTNLVWGYDGKNWAPISNDNVLPAVRDAVLFPYYTMVKRSTGATYDKKVTWMVMGGMLNDGKLNSTSYISRNQGINWAKGENSVQQPAHMPAFYGAQVFSFERTQSSASTLLMSYNPGQVTPVTQWQCPYLYLFGGYAKNGGAHNSVWEGVLTGLTFKPVF